MRHVMGDEKFFAGIRDYYRTYRDRNALTDDLRKVMEFHRPAASTGSSSSGSSSRATPSTMRPGDGTRRRKR